MSRKEGTKVRKKYNSYKSKTERCVPDGAHSREQAKEEVASKSEVNNSSSQGIYLDIGLRSPMFSVKHNDKIPELDYKPDMKGINGIFSQLYLQPGDELCITSMCRRQWAIDGVKLLNSDGKPCLCRTIKTVIPDIVRTAANVSFRITVCRDSKLDDEAECRAAGTGTVFIIRSFSLYKWLTWTPVR